MEMEVIEAAGRPSLVAPLSICWLVCLCQPPVSYNSRRAHLISAHALHDGRVVCMRLGLPREPRSKGRPELIPASSSPDSLRALQSRQAVQLVSHSSRAGPEAHLMARRAPVVDRRAATSGGGSTGQKPMSLLSMGTAPCRAKTLSSVSSIACRADTCSHEAIFARVHAQAVLIHALRPKACSTQAEQSQTGAQGMMSGGRRVPGKRWGCQVPPQAADSLLAC